MSDARTQAIRKLAAELVQELQNTLSKDGGERWVSIAIRKMEQVPDREPLKPPNVKLPLSFGRIRFDRFSLGVVISTTQRRHRYTSSNGYEPEQSTEVSTLTNEDVEKLKRWLNGE